MIVNSDGYKQFIKIGYESNLIILDIVWKRMFIINKEKENKRIHFKIILLDIETIKIVVFNKYMDTYIDDNEKIFVLSFISIIK